MSSQLQLFIKRQFSRLVLYPAHLAALDCLNPGWCYRLLAYHPQEKSGSWQGCQGTPPKAVPLHNGVGLPHKNGYTENHVFRCSILEKGLLLLFKQHCPLFFSASFPCPCVCFEEHPTKTQRPNSFGGCARETRLLQRRC